MFYIFSIILLAAALGVVTFKNPMYSALCLILNMLCIAGLFADLGAHFLATTQVIVYAGAVMILVVFVLMLLNVKTEGHKQSSIVVTGVTLGSAALFVAFLVPLLKGSFLFFNEPTAPIEGSMEAIGKELFTNYVFPFEAASILIMAAVAGSVMLARGGYKKHNNTGGLK